MGNIDTTATLAKITVNQGYVSWFADKLKAWPKGAGERPTAEMFMVAHLLDGKRAGVETMHIAMGLRPEGCTVTQYLLGSGANGPANNYRRTLVKAGWLSCVPEGKPYAYKLTFTAKGVARLEKGIAAAAEAATAAEPAKPAKAKVKAKGKRKAKAKVTVTPAETPTSDAPAVSEAPVAEIDQSQQWHADSLAE